MTKKKKAAAGTKPSPEALQSVQEIRMFHDLGGQVMTKARDDDISVAAATRSVASSEGVSGDAARKAASFFELYPEGTPEWLFALSCDPENKPLTVGHVRSVLWLERDSERRKYLTKAAKEGWSVLQLQREIQTSSKNETDHGGGPRIKAPKDLVGTLDQLIKLTEDWLKRNDSIWGRDESWPPKTGYGQTTPETSKRIEKALEQVARLKHGCDSVEARLKKAKRQLKRSSGPA